MPPMGRNHQRACKDTYEVAPARGASALAVGVVLALLVAACSLGATAQGDPAAERARMVATIETHAKQASIALGRHFIATDILKVVGDVPRHEFVPDRVRGDAYADRPLPIGYGQTISQPFIVALMSDLLRVRPGDIVLEVGTGSGYQAAVLAHLARQVYTIEIVPAYGWEEAEPFDGIIVTAAASQIPPPLIRQLNPGRRMVIPLGAPFALQHLVLVERNADDGRVTTKQLLPVSFVPLTSGSRQR